MTTLRRTLHRHALVTVIKPGKQALTKPHRKLVLEEKRSVTDSLDLDSDGPTSLPGEKRWDYVLGLSDGTIEAVEPHPAETRAVDDLIAKKAWAARVLLQAGARVERWHWVVTGAIGFARGSRHEKLLAAHGLAMPVRVVKL